MVKLAITDIETDNLLDDCTVMHCGTIMDLVTGEYQEYRPHQIDLYLEDLEKARGYINHNILGFDFPALKKLYDFRWTRDDCCDTLVTSRALFPDRPGGHSLEALGRSLGVLKGDFGHTNSWETFTEDMMVYNVQDCRVTRAIWINQMKTLGWDLDKFLEVFQWN